MPPEVKAAKPGPSEQAVTESGLDSPEGLRALYAQYVDQIRHGCQNSECAEELCYTGSTNANARNVRRYTARSARAIAIAVCSRPNPRRHLCLHKTIDPDDTKNTEFPPEGPRDPSSLIQLLCDTQSTRKCEASDYTLAHELNQLHQTLHILLSKAGQIPTNDLAEYMSNTDLVDALVPCLDWLFARMPKQRTAIWSMIDHHLISKGYAFPPKDENWPSDDKYNAWLTALDFLHHEPFLRLLKHVIEVMGRRMKLECQLDRIRVEMRCISPSTVQASRTRRISMVMAQLWSERVRDRPDTVVVLIIWLKRLLISTWDSTPTVQPGSVPYTILEILQQFASSERLSGPPYANLLTMPMLCSRLSELQLAESWRDTPPGDSKHILHYPLFLSTEQKFLCFRTINHVSMREAHSSSSKAYCMRQKYSSVITNDESRLPLQVQHDEAHYILLYVSRGSILNDTFDQLWQRRKGELRRPLRVRMGADELDIGHDLGGVQIEFFNLVCRELFSESGNFFTTDPATGLSVFHPGSLQPLHMYEIWGIILALAMYNGITLPIRLPWIYYHILTSLEIPLPTDTATAISWISDAWPTVSRSLHSILEHNVDDLEFVFSMEANGVRLSALPLADSYCENVHTRLSMEVSDASSTTPTAIPTGGSPSLDMGELEYAWPGWRLIGTDREPEIVGPGNRDDYVKKYSSWLYYHSVVPQMQAFVRGFKNSGLISHEMLSILGATNLKAYTEGTDRLNITELQQACRYDGYEAKSRYIQTFWRIVESWSEEKQKRLLKFVTAAERIPITGAHSLTFLIRRAYPENKEALPTSSTCFGTLMLPKYGNAEILAEKLTLALKYGAEGFGTG